MCAGDILSASLVSLSQCHAELPCLQKKCLCTSAKRCRAVELLSSSCLEGGACRRPIDWCLHLHTQFQRHVSLMNSTCTQCSQQPYKQPCSCAGTHVPNHRITPERDDRIPHRVWQDPRLPAAHLSRAQAPRNRGGVHRQAAQAAPPSTWPHTRTDRSDWHGCQVAVPLLQGPLGCRKRRPKVRPPSPVVCAAEVSSYKDRRES